MVLHMIQDSNPSFLKIIFDPCSELSYFRHQKQAISNLFTQNLTEWSEIWFGHSISCQKAMVQI